MKRSIMSLVLLGLLFWIPPIFSQGTTSRVTGVVTDPTGAVVPEAVVTLTNEATRVSYTTRTTSAGTYVFDSIPIGTYTVTVEKEGFKRFVSTGNVLTIGQPMTVNVRLEVGQIAEAVEVTATAELVQTSTSGNFGNLVNQQAIQNLPIVGVRGRNPLTFVLFQPGVVSGANTGGAFTSTDRAIGHGTSRSMALTSMRRAPGDRTSRRCARIPTRWPSFAS
jgi:hypothetical protein